MKRLVWTIFFIFLLFSFILYFFKFPKVSVFDADQEFYAKQYQEIFLNHKMTLLGIQTSVGGIFVGPLYTYFSALVYVIFKGNPIGIQIVTLIIMSFQASFTYLLFSRMKNQKAGIIAGMIILISAQLWSKAFAPSLINWLYLPSLFFFYGLTRLKQDQKWFWYLGLILGFTIHIHVTLWCFFPVFVIFIIWQKLYLKFKIIDWIKFFCIIIIFTLPLFLFEIRHNFFILHNFLKFISGNVVTHQNLWIKTKDLFFSIHNLLTYLIIPKKYLLIQIFLIFSYLYFLIKLKSDDLFKTGGIFLLIAYLIFIFYQGPIPDYYFYFLLPVLLFVSSSFLADLFRFKIGKLIIPLMFIYIIYENLLIMQKAVNPYNLFQKMKAVSYIKSQVGITPVRIFLETDLGQQFGFEYLSDYVGIVRKQDQSPPIYQIVVKEKTEKQGAVFQETGAKEAIHVVKIE